MLYNNAGAFNPGIIITALFYITRMTNAGGTSY